MNNFILFTNCCKHIYIGLCKTGPSCCNCILDYMVSYSHISLVPDRLMQPVEQASTMVVASHHFPSIQTSKGLVHDLVLHGQISRYCSDRELFDSDDTEHFEMVESFLPSGCVGRIFVS